MKANYLTVVEGDLSVHRFQFFFIDHLIRFYCAKRHLHERLSEISEHAHFKDLKDAINKTLANVEEDISRINKIYMFLGLKYNFKNCNDVITLIENSFVAIYQKSSD